MIAGTLKSSPANRSMSACSASSRCWPSIARRMPSRSGTFRMPDAAVVARRLEVQLLVAADDHGAGNRREIARLAALLVVLHELVDLAADDLALIGLFARRDAALEQVPVHLGRRGSGPRLAAAHRRLGAVAVAEHLEADKLVDVAGGQGRLVELDPELLHPNRGNVDHGVGVFQRRKERDFTERTRAHLNGYFPWARRGSARAQL